jgi:SNF2 family DNA or RNA helicase
MDFLHPGMLGSFAAFRKYYSDIADNPALQQDLAARVSPFLLRRTKLQVGQELPPKQERTIFCSMDSAQQDLYEEVRANGLAQLAKMSKGDVRAGTEIFTTLLRLRQICCHPGLLPEKAGENVSSAKFELLQELVMEHIDSGHKLLLFSQFTSLLSKISEWLDEQKIPYEYLDGATRNRQAHVDHFNNDPSVPLFLLSLKAGGTGLNLTSADTVVICDPWWNPAVELQAADRTHRIGQTRQVTMLKLLVKDSIEEKILAMQQQKQEIFDNVIENPGAVSGKFSLEELRFLLS